MKLLLTSIALTLCSLFLHAQELTGLVVDIDNQPIVNAQILNEQKRLLATTDSMGIFTIDLSRNPIFGIEKRGYSSRWYKMGDRPKKTLTVVLDYSYQEILGVTVTEKGPSSALDIYSVNIIDYKPFGSRILTLKRDKKDYYIGVDSVGQVGPRYIFDLDRPRRLFQDCMGNMHVVCTDRVYQIAIAEDSLIIVDDISKNVFKEVLAPCIAKFDSGLVMKELSRHNQVYDLALYRKGETPLTFYRQIDEVTAAIAAEEALKLEFSVRQEFLEDSLSNHILGIRRYLRQVHNGENPDINLQFMMQDTRAIDSSNTRSNQWSEQMVDYMIRSYPIDVRAFQIAEYVGVIDFEIDSVSIYNSSGAFIQSAPFSVEGDIKEVWQDSFNEGIYLYTRNKGNHLLFHLDMLSGRTTFLKNMKTVRFSESEKIYKGWLYYREIENGFFQINRLKLPVH